MGKGELSKSKTSTSAGARSSGRDAKKSVKNKNISKKDFDKIKRVKRHSKLEKVKQRKALREKELALKKVEK